MTLKERIHADMTAAMKAGQKPRLGTLRMMRAKIQEAEIAGGADFNDEQVVLALGKFAKQVKESIEGFAQAGRDEQKRDAEAELAVVESYLPQQLTDEEVTALVKEAMQETGASSAKDMGKLMSAVMPKVKGRADGKKVNQIVRTSLGA